MIARSHYDRDTLARFLDDTPTEEQGDIAEHLEQCDKCQSTLESLMGDGLTMEAAGELLRTVAADGIAWDSSKSEHSAEGERWDFLEHSDHPESLGRFARFEIMEILGRGGMGIVMRGYDTSLNRHSAVKVLAPELATSAAARKRFSREAKSAAAVVHPHVVHIHSVDEHNGLPYLVMPVVEGQSVDARVRGSGPVQVIEAVRIAAQVAEGLAAAHEQGLVHRDIKPANVLLENGVERVQITDFGLARAIDDASMTRSGVIAGTPQYMSPEQAHGDAIDHRSDLFSLGSLIYFMLTGHSPFRAETTMGVLNRIGNEQPRSLRSINAEIPEWFESVVMKLLAKSPDDRFQSASKVAQLLEDCLAHLQQPTTVPLPKSVERLSPSVYQSQSDRDQRMNHWGQWFYNWPPIGKFIATAAFASALIFAGVVVVLELDKGTLTIESEADDVPIRIMQGDEVVKELTVTKMGTSVRVASGKYVVVIDGEFSDVHVESGAITLGRGATHAVRIVQSNDPATAASISNKTPTLFRALQENWQRALHGRWKQLDHEEGEQFNQTLVFYGGFAHWLPEAGALGVRGTFYVEGNDLVISFYTRPETFAAFEMSQLRINFELDGDLLIVTREGETTRFHRIAEPNVGTRDRTNKTLLPKSYGPAYANSAPAASATSPTPVHTLSQHVNWFNRKAQTTDGDFKQPPLTADEVLCFAQWKLQTEKELPAEEKALLTNICIRRWLPEGWEFEGGPGWGGTPGADLDVYRIQLLNRSSDQRIVLRERYLAPPAKYLKPADTEVDDAAMPLSAAITQFNAMHNQVDGLRQPPLTLEEVLAAIVDWGSRRDEAPVDNETFARFQEIAKTHQLPADTKFEVIPSFGSLAGDAFKIWSVRLVMPQADKPEWTYAFTIRTQYLTVNSDVESKIHWGKPNDDGLQVGVRMIPSQRVYQATQAIETEFLYRSISGESIPVTLPNIYSHKRLLAYDADGKELDVVEAQVTTVGGALQTGIGETPTRCKGKTLQLGLISPDPKHDSLSPRYTYLTVKGVKKVVLTYVVSDFSGGELGTGEVAFDIAKLLPAKSP